MMADDFDENGSLDLIMAHYENDKLYPVRDKLALSEQMNFVRQKFTDFSSFAQAEVSDIVGQQAIEDVRRLKAITFASGYLLNEGSGKFKFRPFPDYAQLSSINAFIVQDFNRDGSNDILLAGNFFETEVNVVRNDASLGLLLLGDGSGNFKAIPPAESGFLAGGNVKAMRIISTKKDLYVLVANNNSSPQFFKVLVRDARLVMQ
jgi:hypothetical protein